MQATPVQSDYDKLRRLPFLYGFSVLTATAVLCTVQAPMALFATELGLSESQIGLLGGIMPFFQVVGLAALPLITRFGSRRISATALACRYAFLLLFLVAPFYADHPATVFALMLCAMIGFSLLRSISEAASVPWSQEFLPRSVRGRVSGRVALMTMPVALVLSLLIKLWLDSRDGLDRFFPVFGVGILAGVIGALLLFGLRGGAPRPPEDRPLSVFKGLRDATGDRNFMIFLFASATQYLVFISMNLFVLLYFRERLGLASGQLVLLVAFVPVGGALGSMCAGWFVDRYGTRVIRLALQMGQVCLLLVLPLIHADIAQLSILVGFLFFLFGLLFQAGIGVDNIYMLNTVPPASKESYMALHYSMDGIIGGAVTFLAGYLLIYLTVNPVDLFGLVLRNYTVLFLLAAMVSLISAFAFSRLREEGAVSVRDFVSQVSTGSTLRALWGISRYGGRTSEERRRDLAYGFGSSGSPLAKQELIDALHDPSFDVRHEAIRSMGHIGPHPDVVAALSDVLEYDGLIELQYAALAALGRAGAMSAAPRVAAFLDNPNPLLRSRAVRTLADLRDSNNTERVRRMLIDDPDLDCRLAAASHLGKVQARDMLDPLIAFYVDQADDHTHPMSEPRSKVILLALAKILNVEALFAQYWRREEKNPGLALSELTQALATALPAAHPLAKRLTAIAANPAYGSLASTIRDTDALVANSKHVDAPLVRTVVAGTTMLDAPHPALLVLLLVALRRVLKR